MLIQAEYKASHFLIETTQIFLGLLPYFDLHLIDLVYFVKIFLKKLKLKKSEELSVNLGKKPEAAKISFRCMLSLLLLDYFSEKIEILNSRLKLRKFIVGRIVFFCRINLTYFSNAFVLFYESCLIKGLVLIF